jgi:hypothetical protein
MFLLCGAVLTNAAIITQFASYKDWQSEVASYVTVDDFTADELDAALIDRFDNMVTGFGSSQDWSTTQAPFSGGTILNMRPGTGTVVMKTDTGYTKPFGIAMSVIDRDVVIDDPSTLFVTLFGEDSQVIASASMPVPTANNIGEMQDSLRFLGIMSSEPFAYVEISSDSGNKFGFDNIQVHTDYMIPEPGSGLLILAGFLGLIGFRKIRSSR